MDAKRTERLKKYVTMISKSRGGLDGLLAGPLFAEPSEAPPSALESFSAPGLALRDAARSALETIAIDGPLTTAFVANTEAIISEELRPAIDITGGKFTVTHPLWTHLSDDTELRERIEGLLPSIGRIELPGNKKFPYGGTGFVIGDGVIMTNRHVAEIFARGLGDRRLDFITGAQAGIDFVREFGTPSGPTLLVSKVLMIHPYWDMALLAVDGLDPRHKPLKLACRDARHLVGTQIAVVGYPAFDPRNPADIQKDLFNQRFGVKRLQPGELQGQVQAASFGKFVPAAGHDCSTLGGNSGSAVLDLASGEVLGLHFGGVFHDVNYSVPSIALASDSRVLDAGVHIAGPRPAAVQDWINWWRAADLNEGVRDEAPAAAPLAPAAPGAGTSTEAMVEPEHDSDYSNRTGFAADFLGAEAAFRVALPAARDPAAVAPLLDGGAVLHYQNFSLAMHARRRLALFTASNITRESILRNPEPGRKTTRTALSGLGPNDREKWFLDPRMDARYQLPDIFFTKDRQAFDKGHIVRRDDVAWGASYEELKRANGDSYHVTNCSPQVMGFNQSAGGIDNWGDLENSVLAAAATERLTVLAGPVLKGEDQVFVGVGPGGAAIRARVPSSFWKVIVARSADGLAAFGFVLEQDLDDVQWEEFVVPDNFLPMLSSLETIQDLTGLAFGQALLDADQYGSEAAIELVVRGAARVD